MFYWWRRSKAKKLAPLRLLKLLAQPGAAAALKQEAESHATSLEYMSDDDVPDGEFPLLLCALCEGGAMFTHTCQDCQTSYAKDLRNHNLPAHSHPVLIMAVLLKFGSSTASSTE